MSVTDKGESVGSVRERLEESAVTLFQQDGYENVTAAQIAAMAGVTERTFFRYFPDKREVLFGREDLVRESVLSGIAQVADDLGPLDMLFAAYENFRPIVEERRAYAKPRQALIDAHPALQERELSKIAALADAIAAAIEERGVPRLRALLAARIGMMAIVQATNEWLSDDTTSLSDRFVQARGLLRQLAK